MKTTHIILIMVVGFGLYWLYAANPMNIFQRGNKQ